MKKYLFLPALLMMTMVVFGQSNTDRNAGPVLTFDENTFDFGDIHQGDKVDHVFKFANTGTEPLLITNIQVTCGCTAPSWPRTPIAPGQKSEIRVSFNSEGKMGKQNKVVTVISNATNDDNKITFTANVLPADGSQPQ